MYRLIGDTHTLGGLLGATSAFLRSMDTVRRAQSVRVGISGSELRAMARIAEASNITPKALAASLELSTPAVTAITGSLVESGLIARVANPRDRRSLFLQLTAQGHEMMDSVYRNFQAAIALATRNLTEQEADALQGALEDLAAALVTPESLALLGILPVPEQDGTPG